MNRSRSIVFFVVTLLAAFPATARADFIQINPRATYLRTNNDSDLNAVPIDLLALSFAVNPGDVLLLEQLGAFDNGPGTDSFTTMIAIFSASPTLLPNNNLNRVVGAIDAGTDVTTSLTFSGSLPTDIAQDFLVPAASAGGVAISVPVGARYLFVSTHDVLFGDNSDPNQDYGIRITATGPVQATPAPSGLVLLSFGVGCVAAGRVRRRAH